LLLLRRRRRVGLRCFGCKVPAAVEAEQAAVADRAGGIEGQIILVPNWLVADWCRICVRAIHQH
jgi:hypothetical protein